MERGRQREREREKERVSQKRERREESAKERRRTKKTHLVAVADGVEVRGRDREQQREEARDGVEGDHEDDADDIALEERFRVVPEVLDDLHVFFCCCWRGGGRRRVLSACSRRTETENGKPSTHFSSVFPVSFSPQPVFGPPPSAQRASPSSPDGSKSARRSRCRCPRQRGGACSRRRRSF